MSKHENSKKYFCPRYHVLIDLAFLILSVKYFQLKTRESAFSQKLDTLKSSAIFGNIKGSWNSLSFRDIDIFIQKIFEKKCEISLQLLSSVQSEYVINSSSYLHIIATTSSYLWDSYKLCQPIPPYTYHKVCPKTSVSVMSFEGVQCLHVLN